MEVSPCASRLNPPCQAVSLSNPNSLTTGLRTHWTHPRKEDRMPSPHRTGSGHKRRTRGDLRQALLAPRHCGASWLAYAIPRQRRHALSLWRTDRLLSWGAPWDDLIVGRRVAGPDVDWQRRVRGPCRIHQDHGGGGRGDRDDR